MSVIDELSPYIRAYPKAFRMARARCGLTNEELSDRSGVPYSTVALRLRLDRAEHLIDGQTQHAGQRRRLHDGRRKVNELS